MGQWKKKILVDPLNQIVIQKSKHWEKNMHKDILIFNKNCKTTALLIKLLLCFRRTHEQMYIVY